MSNFKNITSYDFVKHKGEDSYFYACHTLGIVTHGFEMEVTENIVRKLIIKCFELLDDGITATPEQHAFYEKYLQSYRDNGPEFVEFENIGLNK